MIPILLFFLHSIEKLVIVLDKNNTKGYLAIVSGSFTKLISERFSCYYHSFNLTQYFALEPPKTEELIENKVEPENSENIEKPTEEETQNEGSEIAPKTTTEEEKTQEEESAKDSAIDKRLKSWFEKMLYMGEWSYKDENDPEKSIIGGVSMVRLI